ncbi:M24 family metallopeptidase [Truepera radiovictrix]|jgi:Xaa-Pro aminopeptidase|nr:M24 family metallopeptidase [Truepera radiovictrix]WMT58802.1 M24 family metallopeptidase [Truepera radiovictrix]
MTRRDDPARELSDKLSRLRKTMAAGGFGAAHLAKLGNLAWLLCGGDALVSFADPPVAEAVVTPQRVVVLMAEIERDRLEREAFPPGVEARYYPWHDPGAKRAALGELIGGRKVLADAAGVAGAEVRDFWTLRTPLTPEEVARYRALGRDAAEAFTDALTGLEPGLREHDVAGRLAKALRERGMQPALILVAADERLKRYRHPLPTDNRFAERLMAVACARRGGLYANLTRLVSRRPLGEDAAAYRGLLEVEGVLLRYTQHGVLARELFREVREAYAAIGFPDEWRRHHQGGACGYETRDFVLQPNDTMLVDGSAYAWNPSLPGLKVEDTVLLLEDRLEVLTADPRWPSVEVSGRARPDVLVLEP